jgi:acyl-CoA reductase-like NAD-dependent aldehyde dehydrogenase
LKLADLIEANIPELARLEALQAGKSISFATMEYQNPVETFRCNDLDLSY